MSGPTNMYLGVGRTAAYALGVLRLEVVSRKTIRVLLPEGKMKDRSDEAIERRRVRGLTGTAARNRNNTTNEKLRVCLKKFESWGWIGRDGHYIKVYNPKALLTHAVRPDTKALGEQEIAPKTVLLLKSMVPGQLLALDSALNDIKISTLELTRTDLIEQARRERVAIERLMRASIDPRDRVRKLM